MRLTQQAKRERLKFIIGYAALFIVTLMIGWWFLLLFSSRPIVVTDKVLGATTNGNSDVLDGFKLSDYPVLKSEDDAPNLSRRWVLMDGDSESILAAQNEDLVIPIASTTKIMTAFLVLENVNDLSEIVTIDRGINNIYQSQPRLLWGDQFTVKDLLYMILLESDNQAANTLALYAATKIFPNDETWENRISRFVGLMNDRAKELNMKKTEFHDPAGLEETTVSTAAEMAKLTKYTLENNMFKKIVATPEITVWNVAQTRSFALKNSNRLVSEWNYPGVIGVKTGFLPNRSPNDLSAGHCLIAAAKRNNRTLIVAVYNTLGERADSSATNAKILLDWGFENIKWY